MRFQFTALVFSTLLITSISASPAPVNSASLPKRSTPPPSPKITPAASPKAQVCVTLQEAMDYMDAHHITPHNVVYDNTVFWSKPAIRRDAEKFAATVGGGYFTSYFPETQQAIWRQACGTNFDESAKIDVVLSEATAKKATGTAYIMLKNGEDLGRMWKSVEYPALVARNIPVIAVDTADHNKQSAYVPH